MRESFYFLTCPSNFVESGRNNAVVTPSPSLQKFMAAGLQVNSWTSPLQANHVIIASCAELLDSEWTNVYVLFSQAHARWVTWNQHGLSDQSEGYCGLIGVVYVAGEVHCFRIRL